MNRKDTAILFLMVLLAIGVVSSPAAALSRQDAEDDFIQANEMFRQANSLANQPDEAKKLYAQSALHYEKIINDAGIKNARLYCNLGNAYQLSGDLGKAIVNYRRSENLDAADADIQKNLAFARSRRIDKVQIKTRKRILETLFFWHYDFSIKVRMFLACLFFGLFFLALTVLLWLGKRLPRAPLAGPAVVSAFLAICLSVSVAIENVHRANELCGVIIVPSVVARQGDGQNYPASFKDPLHSGTEFDVIEHRSGWLHITLSDGSNSWIPDNTAELL